MFTSGSKQWYEVKWYHSATHTIRNCKSCLFRNSCDPFWTWNYFKENLIVIKLYLNGVKITKQKSGRHVLKSMKLSRGGNKNSLKFANVP